MNGTAEVVGAVHKTRRLAKYYDVHAWADKCCTGLEGHPDTHTTNTTLFFSGSVTKLLRSKVVYGCLCTDLGWNWLWPTTYHDSR